MVLVPSKTIIQAHAVVLVTIAGYLIKNPEMITNSDIIFLMGEALRVDFPVVSSPSQNPFVFCALLLFVEAAVDIILLSTLPYHEALDEALPYIRPMRNGNLPAEDLQVLAKLPEYITRSLTLYWNVWISVAACRFFVYGGLAFFIYQGRGDTSVSSYTVTAAVSGFDRLKHRVVFTFAFMEMMAWFWTFVTLREERQERLTKLLEDAKEN
ncbi:Increased loss of mitochondrial DNA protein 1 [Penicillium hispanicum]|uniref:Increased loss of mitochondrial DNA protein 1 n=1 Tax=Penicillium hispanicum TaxID=1080232 RepID=UPI00253F7820|nr:Increased loss of mitochondrial DNA protein 1 [Penicillium hispanicum]KAJ5585276.1 Increased loss of mitochondrial DNA protein 1 [Penicillium hispanicum]